MLVGEPSLFKFVVEEDGGLDEVLKDDISTPPLGEISPGRLLMSWGPKLLLELEFERVRPRGEG
jgi:hypothetical protein